MSEIPAAAVEAAAKAHFEEAMADEERWVSWADLPPDAKERWRDLLRSALVAAAPLIRRATADEIAAEIRWSAHRRQEVGTWSPGFIDGMFSTVEIAHRVGDGGGGGQ
jgi:hypothetical protein